MAPRKGIVNCAASKGKAVATTGRTVPILINNQPHAEDIDSFSLQGPLADVQAWQKREYQLHQMLYEMKEEMKE